MRLTMYAQPRSSLIPEVTYREMMSNGSHKELAPPVVQRHSSIGEGHFGYKPSSYKSANLSLPTATFTAIKSKKISDSSITLPPMSELISPLSPLPGYSRVRAQSTPSTHSTIERTITKVYPTPTETQLKEQSVLHLVNQIPSSGVSPYNHLPSQQPLLSQPQFTQHDAPPQYVSVQYSQRLRSPSSIQPSQQYDPQMGGIPYNHQGHYIVQSGPNHRTPINTQVTQNQPLKKEIKRRTRTGCLTCRKRRIKCDERKPGCNNCEKSKVHCLGYQNKPTKNELKKIQKLQQLQEGAGNRASIATIATGVM